MDIDENPYQQWDQATKLAIDEVAAEIVAAAGRLSAASCAWLLLVAKFDGASGHVRAGFASTAHWLAFACGLAQRTALDHVRVAQALAAHAALAREMSAGRLSYSQVRAIARAAGPTEDQLVEELIEIAQHGTVAQLETIVRGLNTVDHNENGTRDTDREYVKHRWTEASFFQLSARLDPERGELVSSAIKALVARESLSAPDALVRLAEIGLAALADESADPRGLRGHERAAVVVHLDASKLPTPGSAEPPRAAERARPYAHIADGPGLPPHVVERLLCEGRVRTVVRDGDNVLDVGRSHRLVTGRQYRALTIRQHGRCAKPGCANTKNLHAHHVVHWINGGRTDLDNLILLCEPHHLAHHDGEFTIRSTGKGRFDFAQKDGRPLSPPVRDAGDDAPARLHAAHAHVARDAATSAWDGQRLDRGYAVSVLAQRRQHARTAQERVRFS